MSADPVRRARRLQAVIDSAQQAALYQGSVTAVDTSTLTASVDLGGGSVVSGVVWLVPYAATPTVPAVGDLVMVSQVAGTWLILGRTSRTPTADTYTTVTAAATAIYQGSGTAASGSSWAWSSQAPSATFRQGKDGSRFYSAAVVVPPTGIPAGGTVTSAKLRMRRGSSGGVSLVTPTIYRHRLTAPPASGVAPGSALIAGSWRPGSLARGQQATWELPSGWFTQLATGDITGLAVWSDKSADFLLADSPQIIVTVRGGVT